MTHDELARDLAGHLRTDFRMTWCDLQLGPRHSSRPDVFTLDKSFVRPHPTSYEVKVSKADFRRDVTAGKYMDYYDFSGAVVFASEKGLLTKADIPSGVGLIVRSDQAWRVAVKPTRRPTTIPAEVWLKLLIDGVEREGPRYRARAWHGESVEYAKKFGAIAARAASDLAKVEGELSYARMRAESIVAAAEAQASALTRDTYARAPEEWRRLTSLFDLPESAALWQVQQRIRALGETSTNGKWKRIAAALRRTADELEAA